MRTRIGVSLRLVSSWWLRTIPAQGLAGIVPFGLLLHPAQGLAGNRPYCSAGASLWAVG